MCLRNGLGKDDHDRIAADGRSALADLAPRVEHPALGFRVPFGEPGLAREGLRRRCGIGVALGEFLPGDATDEPGFAAEFIVKTLEQIAAVPAAAAMKRPTINAGSHQANDMRRILVLQRLVVKTALRYDLVDDPESVGYTRITDNGRIASAPGCHQRSHGLRR